MTSSITDEYSGRADMNTLSVYIKTLPNDTYLLHSHCVNRKKPHTHKRRKQYEYNGMPTMQYNSILYGLVKQTHV